MRWQLWVRQASASPPSLLVSALGTVAGEDAIGANGGYWRVINHIAGNAVFWRTGIGISLRVQVNHGHRSIGPTLVCRDHNDPEQTAARDPNTCSTVLIYTNTVAVGVDKDPTMLGPTIRRPR